MPFDIGPIHIGDPSTPPPPAFDLAKAITSAPADPRAAKAYWEKTLNDYVAAQGGVGTDAKGKTDPNIAYLEKQAALTQGDVTASTSSGNAANRAANDAAARAEQNRHNQATEQLANRNAQDTNAYHAGSLGIQGQLAQIQAGNEAIRLKAEQDTAAAKGDANKIAQARLQYEQSMAAQTAKLQTLKDQVTSLSSMDNNDVSNQVNQANNRNTDALNMTDKAATLIGGMKGITDPNLAASAMGSILNAGRQYSAQSGGSPVPVGPLTDQHKAEITQLVMAGMPFNQAFQQTGAKVAAMQAVAPQPGGTNPAQPGYSPLGGGGMGIVGQNTGGGGGPGYTVAGGQ